MKPFRFSIYCLFLLIALVSCKRKEATPEAPVNKLLDDESKCRISTYKWDIGISGPPTLVACYYGADNISGLKLTYFNPPGTAVEVKSEVTYNPYGNPESVDGRTFFNYDKNNQLESITRYSRDNVLANGFRIDTIREYKAYFKWEKGNIASITECFFRIKEVGENKYEFEELPPWSYSNFTYDNKGNIIKAEKLDDAKSLRYNIFYEYDDSPNPLRNLFFIRGDYRFQQQLLSKNNCTKLTVKLPDGSSPTPSELTFAYRYDENKYPTNGFIGDGEIFDIKYECR